jgi:macrolide transport system ATP-binding/permease protein
MSAPLSSSASPPTPLIDIRNLTREFPAGDQTITVLRDIDLQIAAGEMVAIIGASGSGKSTLMNIIGCLDRPTRGSYLINGSATVDMQPDELARLRREHFGFIFQRYHLLNDLSALHNVEMPAVYSGMPANARKQQAQTLLQRLGLGHRMDYRPSQLSGGQQQRVSIARALMNGGDVILADEPTGALDTQSGDEVMNILRELHAEGHTVILVTHEASVAAHAERVIEIRDGCIVGDHQQQPLNIALTSTANDSNTTATPTSKLQRVWDRFSEAAGMALRAMVAHRLRTFLTMLGIIIGIASVVSVVALGAGSRQKILNDISAMGTNTIDIYTGKGYGDRNASRIQTMTPRDADVLAQQSFVDSATPGVSSSTTLRYRNLAITAMLRGVGAQYFRVKGIDIAEGVAFDTDAVSRQEQVVVIDQSTRNALFGENGNAIGQVILAGRLPCRIIGVAKNQSSVMGHDENLNLWLPYTTVMNRVLGQSYVRNITVRMSDTVASEAAEAGIVRLLTHRHGTQDFFVMNSDSIRQTVEKTTATMTLLVSMIAVISLVVGGIGVMNIMLVSVTERTREIGVRMAVGARRSDILQQFLIEAILVCLTGGVLGIGLSLLIGWAFGQFGAATGFSMIFSITSIVTAFVCSTVIGIIFGFMPARNAAQLDPVTALARE